MKYMKIFFFFTTACFLPPSVVCVTVRRETRWQGARCVWEGMCGRGWPHHGPGGLCWHREVGIRVVVPLRGATVVVCLSRSHSRDRYAFACIRTHEIRKSLCRRVLGEKTARSDRVACAVPANQSLAHRESCLRGSSCLWRSPP